MTKGIKSFLGFANFYKNFIKGFLQVAIPFSNILKKELSFEWVDKNQRHLKI
jgi:uncharacterized protein YaaR (DUF327 family)